MIYNGGKNCYFSVYENLQQSDCCNKYYILWGDNLKVKFTETILRDANQSLIATRMSFDEFEPVLSELDKAGYAASGENCLTKSEGVFVAGDCRAKSVHQLTTAVGDGSVAALAACNWLDAM